MFALEIISKLVESTLGELGKKIISRGNDPKRRFAHDILTCYQAVKSYRKLCNELLEVVKNRRRATPKSRERHEIDVFQRISDQMAEAVKVIVGKFSFDWSDDLFQSSNKKAKKRYDTLEIFDADLALLLKYASISDGMIVGLAAQLAALAEIASEQSRIKTDWYTQQIILLNSNITEINEALDAYRETVEIVRWGKTLNVSKLSKYLTVVKFDNDGDLDLLIQALHQHILLIDGLIERMAKFMKSNFVLEDLL